MKRLIPFLLFCLPFTILSGQCDDLFFSEYVEGYSNNKALEIYNPTSEAIDLSGYSLARFSNGSSTTAEDRIISLPDMMIEAYDVFVIVVDLTDTTLWDSQFDKPAWNGYNVIDTIYDSVTGLPVMDEDGNVLVGPQYNENGAALFGTEYNEEYDLQCKADLFLCPTYEVNNTMYFNGNDAMALIKGSELSPSGDNLLDVIGVIGEDPEDSIGQDAWVNEDGFWLTKDRTLVRKEEIASGRNDLNDVVFQLGGTFMGEEWLSYRKNNFEYLGIHDSNCNVEETPDRFSCSQGPITGTNNINSVAFKMFPNPNTKGLLNIESEELVQSVHIYDMMGKLVFQSFKQQSANIGSINLQGIENGMYIVQLAFPNDQISIQKLLLN